MMQIPLAVLVVTATAYFSVLSQGAAAGFSAATSTGMELSTLRLADVGSVSCSTTSATTAVLQWDPVPHADRYTVLKPDGTTTDVTTTQFTVGLSLLGEYKITARLGGWSSAPATKSVTSVLGVIVCL